MTSCLSKVTPSFCFAFKTPDDPTTSIIQVQSLGIEIKQRPDILTNLQKTDAQWLLE